MIKSGDRTSGRFLSQADGVAIVIAAFVYRSYGSIWGAEDMADCIE